LAGEVENMFGTGVSVQLRRFREAHALAL